MQINLKKYFGYSAKERIRYKRFTNMMSHILSRNNSSIKWPEIIKLFGYYDYSHLYKDFRKFAANTPGRFLKEAANFCVPGSV